MQRRTVVMGGAGAVALLGAGASAFAFAAGGAGSEPRPPLASISADEHARTIALMRPPKRSRPVVAIIGQNDGCETTDYIIPWSVLTQSGIADVLALATEDRPLKLMPALSLRPQATTAAFDRRYPDGADYLIVPAMHDRDHPDVVKFLLGQARKGATIVGICAGVKTVSAAGLLAGKQATTHWYDVEDVRKANPTMTWVRDRRYVADRGLVTTTGVSASLPVSLALVEAIAGRETAAVLADDLGVKNWDEAHDSGRYRMTSGIMQTAAGNKLAVWNHDEWTIPIASGVDEIVLSLTADAWSRTYKSSAKTASASPGGVTGKRGLIFLSDGGETSKKTITIGADVLTRPGQALAATLAAISSAYGPATAAFVALQLEYPWSSSPKVAEEARASVVRAAAKSTRATPSTRMFPTSTDPAM